MKTVILSSGDELLLGQKVDTNSAWISDQLVACGNMPLYHKTVGDCSADIASAITEAAERAQLVVVTGGLGPTDDDLTRSALAAALGQPLVLDEGALKEIQEFFRKMGREMPVQNRAQAMHPAGTRMLPNPWGTAPGIEAECHSCKIFVFPGVPREMQGMCEKYLIPWLKLQSALHLATASVTTYGAGESTIAAALGELMCRERNPTVGTTVTGGEVIVRIRSEFADREVAKAELARTVALVQGRVGEWVVSLEGASVSETTCRMLLSLGKRIVTAESCTGGLVAKMMTDIPGASDVIGGGWIVYSNKLKESLLGVNPLVLLSNGAVSEAVAAEMALGALLRSDVDYAVSTTGVAGPGGGSPEKPVGTVWIGVAVRSDAGARVSCRKWYFPGDREMIRMRAAKTAINMLRMELLKEPQ